MPPSILPLRQLVSPGLGLHSRSRPLVGPFSVWSNTVFSPVCEAPAPSPVEPVGGVLGVVLPQGPLCPWLHWLACPPTRTNQALGQALDPVTQGISSTQIVTPASRVITPQMGPCSHG